jgi:hypothetical protein
VTESNEAPGTPVVVTTEHRGVFFGFAPSPKVGATTIELLDGQMCVYWSESVKGVLGLAATGPDKRCKITPPVPRLELNKVTSVMHATDEAVKAWQSRPWS